ncbi:hypothetical protein JTB14_031375 [Gonioctena quinquepunctata]|nr:hypothetical protein JTB14_031375 [Gonioctena quinquepunctata]
MTIHVIPLSMSLRIESNTNGSKTNSPKPDFSNDGELSPVKLFELFSTGDLLEFLVLESTKNAAFKNSLDLRITMPQKDLEGHIPRWRVLKELLKIFAMTEQSPCSYT